jgi:branched-subunit amino acid aminotransferase/4-amino-4-deoxychorismate lyase
MNREYDIISVNQNYQLASDYRVELSNRAYRYGDGFFETMHANGCQVQFLDDHFARMQYAASLLHLQLPDYLTLEFLNKQIAGLLSRCKLFQGARVKASFIRIGDGYYIPGSLDCDVIMEASYIGKGFYELDEKPLIIGLYEEHPKPKVEYLKVKSLNAQPYILAGIYARENQLNDVLLVNDQGFIVEATSSNLFGVYEKNLITPSLDTGCVQGIMRKQIVKLGGQLQYKVDANAFITKEDLLSMDELFLTNSIVGIRSVTAFENRRYFKKNAQKLLMELNKQAFSSSSRG